VSDKLILHRIYHLESTGSSSKFSEWKNKNGLVDLHTNAILRTRKVSRTFNMTLISLISRMSLLVNEVSISKSPMVHSLRTPKLEEQRTRLFKIKLDPRTSSKRSTNGLSFCHGNCTVTLYSAWSPLTVAGMVNLAVLSRMLRRKQDTLVANIPNAFGARKN